MKKQASYDMFVEHLKWLRSELKKVQADARECGYHEVFVQQATILNRQIHLTLKAMEECAE